MGESLHVIEWIVDIAWTVEIFMSFLEATDKRITFKQTALNYLSFWFWIDALSTFPAMLTSQLNPYVNLTKFGRIFHFSELFMPFRLLLEYCMKNAIRKKIDNTHSLVKLFASALLLAHFSACAWIYVGKRDATSWVNVLENGIVAEDGMLI